MTPVEKLLAKLPDAKKVSSGWSARCPAHEDRRASLCIAEGNDGTVLVKCQAGCKTSAVLAAVELKLADLFANGRDSQPSRNGKTIANGKVFQTAKDAVRNLEQSLGRRSATWTYYDAQGEPVGLVIRWERSNGKDIRPVSRHQDGWRIGAMTDPRPLYHLPVLGTAQCVVVVEGEKAAEAACSLGFVATTSAGGSQASAKTDWSPLAGKEVWILPDNDVPGRKYADTVAKTLSQLTPTPVVRIVELPGLPEGGDIVDWVETHGDAAEPAAMKAELEAFCQGAGPWQPQQAEKGIGYRPFPVDALPEPIRGFVDAGARAIGCDPSYLVLPLLTALASAIGNARCLELKRGWSAPALLWSAIVGDSGTAKTPAFKLVMWPIRERQRKALERHQEAMKHYESELAHWEKDYAAWKRNKNAAEEPPKKPEPPPCERFIVSDTTVEALAPILLANPRGVLLARDELSGWFGSFDRYAGKGKASSDSANWLSMYNAESIIVDRKTGTPRTLFVPQAAVSVTGGIQPGILQRALSVEHRESGLAARLLLACPPRRPKRWTEADIAPRLKTDLVRMVDRLFELQPTTDEEGAAQPVAVQMTPEAKAVWIAYYNEHAMEQADLVGELSAAWSKLEEYAARLALVIHFIRWAAKDKSLTDEGRVDLDSMHAAIFLTQWFKHEATRVYALLDETDAERDQRRLLEWLGRKGEPVTARQVQQNCRWLKAAGAAEQALQELVDGGHGWWIASSPGQRGQPTRRFKPFAASTIYGNPPAPQINGNTVDVDGVDTSEIAGAGAQKPTSLYGASSAGGPYGDGY